MQIHGIFRNRIRLVVVGPILNILLYQFSHSNIDYTLRHSHPSHTHCKFYNTSPSFIIRNQELGSRSKNLIEQTLKAFKNIPFDFSHTHTETYHVYPDFPLLILSSALHTTHCPFNPIVTLLLFLLMLTHILLILFLLGPLTDAHISRSEHD